MGTLPVTFGFSAANDAFESGLRRATPASRDEDRCPYYLPIFNSAITLESIRAILRNNQEIDSGNRARFNKRGFGI